MPILKLHDMTDTFMSYDTSVNHVTLHLCHIPIAYNVIQNAVYISANAIQYLCTSNTILYYSIIFSPQVHISVFPYPFIPSQITFIMIDIPSVDHYISYFLCY